MILGILGGGQLGRMTALAAANFGIKTIILTPEKNSPAAQVAFKTIQASYSDKKALFEFAKLCDFISFEFENIPFETVDFLQKKSVMRPNWQALHVSQNRLREKNFARKLKIKTAEFAEITNLKKLEEACKKFGEAILKTTELGYDGKGQFKINSKTDLKKLWKELPATGFLLEEKLEFVKEISVLVARSHKGEMQLFPVQENTHKNGILDETIVPARISATVAKKAGDYAKKLANELDITGLLAVEFFVSKNSEVIFNEMAPRPHNSGHWSMDGCNISQFEQFVRAVCGLPLIKPQILHKTRMRNLIGGDIQKLASDYKNPRARIHLYGKQEAKPGRKMGHINYI